MKKYLRLIIEVVLGLLLAGALALAYWSYSGKTHAMHELTDVSEEVTEAQQELEKLTKELAEAGADAVAATGRRSAAIQVDVRKPDSVTAMVDAVVKQFGRLDIAMNNAGVVSLGGIGEFDHPRRLAVGAGRLQ